MPAYIHHIEWCVRELDKLCDQLVNQFGFHVIAARETSLEEGVQVRQCVVKSGYTQFVLTQKTTSSCSHKDQTKDVKDKCEEGWNVENERFEEETVYPVLTCCSSKHQVDSVFNVCLEVGNVDKVTKSILDANKLSPRAQSVIIIPPKSIKVTTTDGSILNIRYSVVKSPCGNIIHTLINSKEYKEKSGMPFLPGFKNIFHEKLHNFESLRTTHMDHVTYVCKPNQSYDILKWYKVCFGMQPFQIVNSSNPNLYESHLEPEEQKQFDLASIDIGEEVGMKMTVGEWITSWLCNEEGVQFPDVDDVLNFKLVLAEPLEENSDSHVQHFLDSHGGPGLQHIGLTSTNVTETVQWMNSNGAKFRMPPPAYYHLESKRNEILSANEDIEKFKSLGLLLDSEADVGAGNENHDRFLIQIFTQPLFLPTHNTFFLEILERRGARGFGAGNITALAKSIILQQQLEAAA